MADEVPAARSIEAFFHNPDFIMQSPETQSNMPKEAGCSPMGAQDDNSFNFDLSQEEQTSTATIKNVAGEVADEPVFWHGYTSDEEAASPIGVDDMEWDEMDDASLSDLPEPSPAEEQTAAIVSQANQLCTRAQAVTILSAGRPKMVTVPKAIDALRTERDPRVQSLPNQPREKVVMPHIRTISLGTPGHQRSSSDYSQKDSLDSSSGVSPLSTAPSSINEQPPLSRRMSVSSKHVPLMQAARHVPLMEAARTISPYSPISPSSPALKSSYTWSQPMAPTSAPYAPRSSGIFKGVSSLINRFDSADSGARRRNSISRIGKNILRKDTLEDIEDEYLSRMGKESTQLASPIIRIPARKSSAQPAKLVARGANERAPVLTLPSYPDEFSQAFESEWPMFSEPAPALSARITTVA